MPEFQLHGDYITLGQLLKSTGMVGSGGDVKRFLAETSIIVNGEAEQRRGRKLRPGDTVSFAGTNLIISSAPTAEETL